MKAMLYTLPLALLTACSTATAPEFAPGTCEAVSAVLSAGQEASPYASLRGAPEMLGEQELEDNWQTILPVFGEACNTAIMRDMFGSDIYVLNCPLYHSPSSLDRPAREAEARAASEAVVGTLSECLGDEWIIRETTENADFEVYHKYVFEPASGRPGADQFNFTVDPIYVTMSFTPSMRGRGGAPGWIAEVQFQEQRATPDG